MLQPSSAAVRDSSPALHFSVPQQGYHQQKSLQPWPEPVPQPCCSSCRPLCLHHPAGSAMHLHQAWVACNKSKHIHPQNTTPRLFCDDCYAFFQVRLTNPRARTWQSSPSDGARAHWWRFTEKTLCVHSGQRVLQRHAFEHACSQAGAVSRVPSSRRLLCTSRSRPRAMFGAARPNTMGITHTPA